MIFHADYASNDLSGAAIASDGGHVGERCGCCLIYLICCLELTNLPERPPVSNMMNTGVGSIRRVLKFGCSMKLEMMNRWLTKQSALPNFELNLDSFILRKRLF